MSPSERTTIISSIPLEISCRFKEVKPSELDFESQESESPMSA